MMEGDWTRIIANFLPMGRMSLMVVTKRHDVASITDMYREERHEVIDMVALCAEKIKSDIGPEGLSLFFNEGKISGQSVPHFHFHVVAREPEDGLENIKRTKEKIPITDEQLLEIKSLFQD